MGSLTNGDTLHLLLTLSIGSWLTGATRIGAFEDLREQEPRQVAVSAAGRA
jgi:hypothetical protein